jgi:hypothetical protein
VKYDARLVAETQTSGQWSRLTRTTVDEGVLTTWDPDLLRDPRVLVPIDVQALVSVPGDGSPACVPMPGPLSPGEGDDPAVLDRPAPFAAGQPRPPGVHLHWAMPDALLSGTLRDPRGNPGGGLDLAALPDRYAVLRLVALAGTETASVRGWLVDAATGIVRDLPAGPSGPALPGTGGRALGPQELTGTAGGTLTWTAGYDSAFGRFAWHDPLDDLAGLKIAGDAATYLVVGWWSAPELDPLDGVRTEGGLAEATAGLNWLVVDGGGTERQDQAGPLARAAGLGVPVRFRSAMPFNTGAFSGDAATVLPGPAVAAEASTLVHGCVVGVPLGSNAQLTDQRPAASAVGVVFGEHVDDLVAAALSGGNRAMERLLAAFAARLLPRLGSPDGMVEVDEFEHARGFAAQQAGEPPIVDRVVPRAGQIPPRSPNPQVAARLTFGPSKASTVVRGYLSVEPAADTVARFAAVTRAAGRGQVQAGPAANGDSGPGAPGPAAGAPAGPPPPQPQLVERPAPPRYLPADPAVAFSGAGRSPRHGEDGRGSTDGRLRCRRGSQVVRGYSGLLEGADVLPDLGSGALPAEALLLAREAVLLSPHLIPWLADRIAARPGSPSRAGAVARLGAELALRYDETGAYTANAGPSAVGGRGTVFPGGLVTRGDRDATAVSVQEILRRHSLLEGVEPDLVAITAWAQPWIPMWAEYEIAVDVATSLTGWQLGAVDLDPAQDLPVPAGTRTVTGRSPLTTAPADTLGAAVARWLVEETQRDQDDQGEADQATQDALARLGQAADAADLVGAACDGVRQALLGLGTSVVRPKTADGTAIPPTPAGPPDLLMAGRVQLVKTRLVDAYGRTLDVPVAGTLIPTRLGLPDPGPAGTGGDGNAGTGDSGTGNGGTSNGGTGNGGTGNGQDDGAAGAPPPATFLRRPRFTAPARCRLRLVGAAAVTAASAVDARIDEVEPARQVSPLCGFLLPDHVDESIEVFDAAGVALGELSTAAIGGGVIWETAPGRTAGGQAVPADAPPGYALSPDAAPLGWLAAGMVAADVAARSGGSGPPPAESALAAFLRAIDTTLWTCDPYAGSGTSALSGIVGRPVAVVRAVLLLDIADDLDRLTLDEAGRQARARAYAELAGIEVPVRLGELTRSDDGLLAYVLDDDFSALRVVDRVVLDLARQAGKGLGHLGPWGQTPVIPDVSPITHPYLVPPDVVRLRPGVPRLVTLLMLPGTAVTLTDGMTPRVQVALARAFFADGLARLLPSIRVGPVLIDPGDVRLPPVAALGERQVLTYRDGPLAWRDDAILAATQDALLPDHPAVLREGWVRVDPSPAPAPGSGA